MKLLTGTHYCMGILQKYDIVKKLMVLELERGGEVLIPQQLSHEKYAMSFKYYDPIFRFINQNISQSKREYYDMRNNLVGSTIASSFDVKMKNILFKSNEQITAQRTRINEKERKHINHHESCFTKELQMSKYIQIDNNPKKAF